MVHEVRQGSSHQPNCEVKGAVIWTSLALVPESIKDIGKAFAELRYRYGDEERVLGIRVNELKKLGPMPEK